MSTPRRTLLSMRKLALVLALIAGAAAAQIALYPGNRKEFTNCSATGSVAQTLTANRNYLMRVTDEDTFVCFAASGSTCSSGGERFPVNFGMRIHITSDLASVSCRSVSAGATGDVIFTQSD